MNTNLIGHHFFVIGLTSWYIYFFIAGYTFSPLVSSVKLLVESLLLFLRVKQILIKPCIHQVSVLSVWDYFEIIEGEFVFERASEERGGGLQKSSSRGASEMIP